MTELVEELKQTRLLAIDASAVIKNTPELVVQVYLQKVDDYINDFFKAIDVDPSTLDQERLANLRHTFSNQPFERAFVPNMKGLGIDEETAQAQLDARPLGFDIKPFLSEYWREALPEILALKAAVEKYKEPAKEIALLVDSGIDDVVLFMPEWSDDDIEALTRAFRVSNLDIEVLCWDKRQDDSLEEWNCPDLVLVVSADDAILGEAIENKYHVVNPSIFTAPKLSQTLNGYVACALPRALIVPQGDKLPSDLGDVYIAQNIVSNIPLGQRFRP